MKHGAHLLHNQSALTLKAALLFRPRVVTTSVPFHLSSDYCGFGAAGGAGFAFGSTASIFSRFSAALSNGNCLERLFHLASCASSCAESSLNTSTLWSVGLLSALSITPASAAILLFNLIG